MILTPLHPAEFPGIETVVTGTLVAATGLRQRGEGYAEPGYFTQLAWAAATKLGAARN